MPYDYYPAVDEDYLFAPDVREANALTPEFRNQVVPMTETQRNNLTGSDLWTNRFVFNTTTTRINRYDGSGWVDISSEAPGIIKAFAGASAPSAHALCNGQVVTRSGIYAALFATIGTQFNTGGESGTEFRLPNLKGKVVVGIDSGDPDFNVLGDSGGEKTHVLTGPETPIHDHGGLTGNENQNHNHSGSTYGEGGHVHTGSSNVVSGGGGTSVLRPYPDVNTGDSGAVGANRAGSGNHGHAFDTGNENQAHNHNIGASGGNEAHNNLQPYIALNYIITL